MTFGYRAPIRYVQRLPNFHLSCQPEALIEMMGRARERKREENTFQLRARRPLIVTHRNCFQMKMKYFFHRISSWH